jgi:hypothetical protein
MDYLNITKYKDFETRAITPENPTGEKGKAAMSASDLGPARKGQGSITLPVNKETIIADITGSGIIKHLWMTIRDHTAAGSFVHRYVILKIYWDDEEIPAVNCPLGDFFCNGFGERYDVNSEPIVVAPSGGMNSYFEMPFKKHARVTLTNLFKEDIRSFFFTVNYELHKELQQDLYFHAIWNRERQTRLVQDYVLLPKIEDKGYYVGTFIGLTALERYWWGEGEFKFYVDGDQEFPTVTSTGMEDYFGGAWAFHEFKDNGMVGMKTFNTPYLGFPYHSNIDHSRVCFETGKPNSPHAFGNDGLPQNALYRWHFKDPISFSKEIMVTLQQIGNDDLELFERSDDLSSVAYWYGSKAIGISKDIPTEIQLRPR